MKATEKEIEILRKTPYLRHAKIDGKDIYVSQMSISSKPCHFCVFYIEDKLRPANPIDPDYNCRYRRACMSRFRPDKQSVYFVKRSPVKPIKNQKP